MLRLFIFALCWVLPALSWAEAPRIVTSLPPLTYALKELVKDTPISVTQVVRGLGSEHLYTLSPEQVRAVRGADLLILIDPNFETFLKKLVQEQKNVLILSQVQNLDLLPLRQNGSWEAHAHEEEHDHHHEHEHEYSQTQAKDYHVWLDPLRMQIISQALAQEIEKRWPAYQKQVAKNAEAFNNKLKALDAQLSETLRPVQGKSYIVFHDAYQYFEKRYGLTAVGSITLHPEHPISAKRLQEVYTKMRDSGAMCIFSEPQFPSKLVDQLAEKTGVRVGILDPLGNHKPDYETALFSLATELKNCLDGAKTSR